MEHQELVSQELKEQPNGSILKTGHSRKPLPAPDWRTIKRAEVHCRSWAVDGWPAGESSGQPLLLPEMPPDAETPFMPSSSLPPVPPTG